MLSVLLAWLLSSAPAGILNMCCQGRLGVQEAGTHLGSCARPLGTAALGAVHKAGRKHKCLFGNVCPASARVRAPPNLSLSTG